MDNLTINSLKSNQKGEIEGFKDISEAIHLMELGCLPGEEFMISLRSSTSDPLCILINGKNICLRKSEAENIIIKPLS